MVKVVPSSYIEHHDEKGEKLFQQLQKAGRIEKILVFVGGLRGFRFAVRLYCGEHEDEER